MSKESTVAELIDIISDSAVTPEDIKAALAADLPNASDKEVLEWLREYQRRATEQHVAAIEAIRALRRRSLPESPSTSQLQPETSTPAVESIDSEQPAPKES